MPERIDATGATGVDADALGGPHPSWLVTPPRAHWPRADDDEPNPYIRWRSLLWSYHRAMAAGWTDDDFVAMVRRLDTAVAGVDGTGFAVTPAAWSEALVAGDTPERLFAKDETANVGGSHKARHLMGLLLHLAVDAVAADTRLAIASCGNAALGAATVARAAGRPIDVFIPTWADPAVVRALGGLEAAVHVCERRDGEDGDPCMARFGEAVADGALAFGVQATENRWTLDGGRTIGWELASQCAADVPAHVFVQVGGGALLTSCAIGLLEAKALGALDEIPAVWAVQAEGCAPFDRAWRALPGTGDIDTRLGWAARHADEVMWPWDAPSSEASGILDDVTYDWLGIARALLRTGGNSVVAAEGDIGRANTLAVAAGFDADHTGTSGLAGVIAALRQERIRRDDATAVLITGVRRSAAS